MHVLVSLYRVGIPGRPVLALLDPATFELGLLELPAGIRGCTGISGLAASDRHIFAVPQAASLPSGVLVLDRRDLALINHHELRSAGDIHSLCFSNGVLYVVSTGTDEVIALRMRGPEVASQRVFWRPDPQGPRQDRHHLNGICRWRGDLLVSGLGPKTGDLWRSAQDGFIFNMTRGETVTTGLRHPHSLAALGDGIAYCESKDRSVRILGDDRTRQLPGYARGLCPAAGKLFAGSSRRRRLSKSTGRIIDAGGTRPDLGHTMVSRLSVDDLEIEASIDLRGFGTEIYDLMPVEDAGRWPVVSDERVRSLAAMCSEQAELMTEEIATITAPGEIFIFVDQDQLAAGEIVAGRHPLPFLERDGQYWGPPPDDETAIREVGRLRRSGASFMLFAWPAFWWLDHYAGLQDYLRTNFSCVLENDRLVAFDLRGGGREEIHGRPGGAE